jgi:hypothetical protein
MYPSRASPQTFVVVTPRRHCEEQSDDAIQTWFVAFLIASLSLSSGGAEPVIGRAFARPVGADPLARNDGHDMNRSIFSSRAIFAP